MNLKKVSCSVVCLVFILAIGVARAIAQVNFICDPSVAASTCNYLNTTISGHYSSTFSNANANIYITYGTTGLGASVHGQSDISYTQYAAALAAITNPSPVQAAALSALNTYDAGPYGSGNVQITSALGAAFGMTGLQGVNTSFFSCALGTTGCYDGVIIITTDPSITLYYVDQGGTEPAGAYDFYTTVEHETDEVLGTGSCIRTNSDSDQPARDGHVATIRASRAVSRAITSADKKATLIDGCGAGEPSSVDLYRNSASGALILDSSLSTKPDAYFSYDGGASHGVQGTDGADKRYNTLANGDDYADFVSSDDCSTSEAVQDAEGCPGQDAGLTILNDGRGEVNILNAIGYNLVPAPAQLVTANKRLVDFGKVVYPPTAPKEDGVDIENDGVVPVTVGPISIAGTYGDLSQFTFDSAKCPASLDSGKKCHITLDFTPDAVTISRATLQIPTSPGSTISIPLTGAGIVNASE